jgi:hypothetical protein
MVNFHEYPQLGSIYYISHNMRVATSCNYVFWTCLVTSHSFGPVSLTSCLRAVMFFCVSQDHFHPWSSSGSDRSVGSLFENHQTQQPNPGTGDLPFVNFVNQKSSHLRGWCSIYPWLLQAQVAMDMMGPSGAIPSNPSHRCHRSPRRVAISRLRQEPESFFTSTFKELDTG